tara:strand:- start:98777 stop:99646 length:870 start_codon:yes stop_codon:yes gene_type:complete
MAAREPVTIVSVSAPQLFTDLQVLRGSLAMHHFPVRMIALMLVVTPMPLATADRLQLSNGDEIQGDLLEFSDGQIRFRHTILGEFNIPRGEVHAIELGPKRGGKRLMADGTPAGPETPEEVIDRLVNPELDTDAVKDLEKGAKRVATPQDAVEQLRREGVDGKTMGQLHNLLPGFGSPEVQDGFRARVEGLMSGSLTIDDIRNEAIDARGQLKELMDDLGPSGAALNGYYGILDGFIKKTDPNQPLAPPGIAPQPIAPLPISPLPISPLPTSPLTPRSNDDADADTEAP